MSRSERASWEQSQGSVGTVASDRAVRAEFEDRAHRERMRPLPQVSSTKHLLKLILASSLLIAAVPNAALAEFADGQRPAAEASSRSEQRSAHLMSSAGFVLALGSGYSNRRTAALVRLLQRRLARGGFAPGRIDGLFGPLTEQAVDRFQTAHGIPVDGIAGPVTLAALRHPPTVLFPGVGYGRRGSVSVRALQTQLARAGYPVGSIDGRYGPRTKRAVARYQASRGLPVDGIAGPRTLAAVQQPNAPSRRPGSRRTRPRGARHRSGAGPNGRRTPSHRVHRQPRRALGHGNVTPGPRSTGFPGVGLVMFLIALAAGVGLTAIWFVRGLRSRRRASTDSGACGPATDPQATQPDPEQPDDVERLFEQAVAFEQRGDDARAIQVYADADRRGHAAAACKLGMLLEHRGNIEAASAAFRRADERGDADGAFNLGFLLEERGDPLGAAKAYGRADQLGHPAAPSNLGVLLEQRGDRTGAMAAFARAVQRGDSAGAFNLAVLLEEQGDHAAAIRTYERAARLGDDAAAELARAAELELRSRFASQAGTREGGVGDGS